MTFRRRDRVSGLLAVGLFLVLAAPVYAEVSDKVIPASQVWRWSLTGSAATLVAAAIHPVLGLVALLPALSEPMAAADETWNDAVGEAILFELGRSYVFEVRVAAFLPFAAYLTGCCGYQLRRRSHQKRTHL